MKKEWAEKYDVFLNSDVAVEFSTPETAISNFYHCFEAEIPLVAGTTGWYKQLPEILNKARQHSASFVYGSNFSVGANLFLMLNKIAAELMNNQYQYDVHIEETHHIHKKDGPAVQP
jgi:4-hydroxy-tetrahydrodipicolinate reductase